MFLQLVGTSKAYQSNAPKVVLLKVNFANPLATPAYRPHNHITRAIVLF